MLKQFPRTSVDGISLSRMLIGTNGFLGFSHKSAAQDAMLREKFSDYKAYYPVLSKFLEHGVDSLMGLCGDNPGLVSGIRYTEEKTGKKIHIIDTPGINVDDTAEGRREAQVKIKRCADAGAEICLIHHSRAEQLVNKNKQTIERLGDYTDMIREAGMVPGLSAHMPELVVYSDQNEYDVETYIQIYNPLGFLMQVEVEYIAKVIHNAKKPVMTIKPFASGRCTPFVGFNFVLNTIRECDMVTVGVMSRHEAAEDIEIAFAALERRYPDIEGRSSPNKDQAAFGKK